ncbi:MAG: hypothetical protein LC777_16080 [Actinobacteria bacterium]|nr:hypothetical protein [Actinomycetota bacterium]
MADAAVPKCLGERATIVGTARSDRLIGTSGHDVIVGRAGSDLIFGGGGDDRICGNRGYDSLYGENGDDLISGGAGTTFCAAAPVSDRYSRRAGESLPQRGAYEAKRQPGRRPIVALGRA